MEESADGDFLVSSSQQAMSSITEDKRFKCVAYTRNDIAVESDWFAVKPSRK